MKHLPLLSFVLLALSAATAADELAFEPCDDPRFAWRAAQQRFLAAGKLLSQSQYQQADMLLRDAAKELPTPYSETAANARKELHAAFQRPVIGEVKVDNDDPFNDPGNATILDFSYIDDRDGGAARLRALAGACAQLQCHYESAEFGLRALKASPNEHSKLSQFVVFHLNACDAEESHFQDLELLLKDERARQECGRLRELFSESRIRNGFAALAELLRALTNGTDEEQIKIHSRIEQLLRTSGDQGGFLAWEEERLQRFGTHAKVRADVYRARERRAREEHDFAAADEWKDRLFRELPGEHQAHIELFESRAYDAESRQDFLAAYDNFRRIYTTYADHPDQAYPLNALNSAARSLKRIGRYEEAIALYKKWITIDRKPLERKERPPEEIIVVLGNEATPEQSVAREISECYEALGNLPESIRWARHDDGPIGPGCFLAYMGTIQSRQFRLSRLLLAAGEHEEGLRLVAELLEGSRDADAADLIVASFHARGKLAELEPWLQKVETDYQSQRRWEYLEERIPFPAFGFPLAGAAKVRELGEVIQWRDRADAGSLWTRLASLVTTVECSAYDFNHARASFDDHDDRWRIQHVVAALESLGSRARPVLLAKIHEQNRLQGWALVLLARQEAQEALERLRGEFSSDPKVPDRNEHASEAEHHVWEQRQQELRDLQLDYVYALSLIKTKEAEQRLASLKAEKRWGDAVEQLLRERDSNDDE